MNSIYTPVVRSKMNQTALIRREEIPYQSMTHEREVENDRAQASPRKKSPTREGKK